MFTKKKLATQLLEMLGMDATSREMIKEIHVSPSDSQFVIEFTEKGVKTLKENAPYKEGVAQLKDEHKKRMSSWREIQGDTMDGKITPRAIRQAMSRLKGSPPTK